MNYYEKYLKYKKKYLNLKKNQLGGDRSFVVGINFEGGKIISRELECENCIGWVNCQIAMDAPFAESNSRIADESVRKQGRSEEVFGYDKKLFQSNIHRIFSHIKNKFAHVDSEPKIIIQIARGRSGESMFKEVLEPVFEHIGLINYEVLYGYRTKDYYDCTKIDEPFVFVNIGMFAVLTHVDDVYVGEICNPVKTWAIQNYDTDNFVIESEPIDWFGEPKNILNDVELEGFKKLYLFGINDDMKFITPADYSEKSIKKLIEIAYSE